MFLVPILLALFSCTEASRPPHLIILCADDVGYNSVGFHGNNNETKTPHIDKLADGGIVFTNFHAFYWCSPSRAALMSGRFPHHIYQNVSPDEFVDRGLPLGMSSLASKLKEVGYKTVHAGKVTILVVITTNII